MMNTQKIKLQQIVGYIIAVYVPMFIWVHRHQKNLREREFLEPGQVIFQ